jgi:hypothetical protein
MCARMRPGKRDASRIIQANSWCMTVCASGHELTNGATRPCRHCKGSTVDGQDRLAVAIVAGRRYAELVANRLEAQQADPELALLA